MTSIHFFLAGLTDYILAVMRGIEEGPGVPEGPQPLKKAANNWLLGIGATVTVLFLGGALLGFVAPTVADSAVAPSTYTLASGAIVFALAVVLYLVWILSKGLSRFYRKMRQRGMEVVTGQRPHQWLLLKEDIKSLLYKK